MSGAKTSLPTAGSESTVVRPRSRYTARNRGLAAIVAAERNFVGANDKLSVIGRPHENGITFEKNYSTDWGNKYCLK